MINELMNNHFREFTLQYYQYIEFYNFYFISLLNIHIAEFQYTEYNII